MWARPLVGLSGHLPSCSAPSSILATGRFVCPTARGGTRGRREASLCHGSGFLLVVPEPTPPMKTSTRLRSFALAGLAVVLVPLSFADSPPAAATATAPDTGATATTPTKADIPPSVLKKYDKNKNGLLDEAERDKWQADLAARREKYQKQRQEMLEKYDLNKDGKISEEEKVAARMDMGEARMEQELQKSREKAGERLAREEADKAKGAEPGAAPATPASPGAPDTPAAPATTPETMTPAAPPPPPEDGDGMMMMQ